MFSELLKKVIFSSFFLICCSPIASASICDSLFSVESKGSLVPTGARGVLESEVAQLAIDFQIPADFQNLEPKGGVQQYSQDLEAARNASGGKKLSAGKRIVEDFERAERLIFDGMLDIFSLTSQDYADFQKKFPRAVNVQEKIAGTYESDVYVSSAFIVYAVRVLFDSRLNRKDPGEVSEARFRIAALILRNSTDRSTRTVAERIIVWSLLRTDQIELVRSESEAVVEAFGAYFGMYEKSRNDQMTFERFVFDFSLPLLFSNRFDEKSRKLEFDRLLDGETTELSTAVEKKSWDGFKTTLEGQGLSAEEKLSLFSRIVRYHFGEKERPNTDQRKAEILQMIRNREGGFDWFEQSLMDSQTPGSIAAKWPKFQKWLESEFGF